MDRHLTSLRAHAHHAVAAPLSDATVAALLARALPRGDERLLDPACGEATWLLRALATHPGATGDGVDREAAGLTRAQQTAEQLGVARRLGLHHIAAADFIAPHRYDLVLSIGAAHAFGGLLPTLAAARGHLAPGGAVLVGEGYGATEAAHDLATLVERITAEGWTPVHGHISTQQELDDYEWSRTGSLAAWALDHPDDPDAAPTLEAAAAHRTRWLREQRGANGFAALLLRPTPA
ncbi:cyclopropane fatty-acyl-phospholipid synthase-like methyltransferase [Kitasatospora sp. MAA4]|uniref:SAM-dependent methyltransferase n=1 Tax=Kitasatospora sp. MAA4 TaxID=3035093 RepID=UPI0024736395|nr:class I SAM-dependent methyltransferase [Kitasatospora sp. MAA4]MDH6136044.1 cyclopropane fatty-acyl-phospholipid synthase-like methyltransferase [Kitasatospora sp. MAA4]